MTNKLEIGNNNVDLFWDFPISNTPTSLKFKELSEQYIGHINNLIKEQSLKWTISKSESENNTTCLLSISVENSSETKKAIQIAEVTIRRFLLNQLFFIDNIPYPPIEPLDAFLKRVPKEQRDQNLLTTVEQIKTFVLLENNFMKAQPDGLKIPQGEKSIQFNYTIEVLKKDNLVSQIETLKKKDSLVERKVEPEKKQKTLVEHKAVPEKKKDPIPERKVEREKKQKPLVERKVEVVTPPKGIEWTPVKSSTSSRTPYQKPATKPGNGTNVKPNAFEILEVEDVIIQTSTEAKEDDSDTTSKKSNQRKGKKPKEDLAKVLADQEKINQKRLEGEERKLEEEKKSKKEKQTDVEEKTIEAPVQERKIVSDGPIETTVDTLLQVQGDKGKELLLDYLRRLLNNVNWEESLKSFFSAIRKWDLTNGHYITLGRYIHIQANKKEPNLSAKQICTLILYMTYVIPPDEFTIMARHNPSSNFLNHFGIMREVLETALSNDHFKNELELLIVLSTYFKLKFSLPESESMQIQAANSLEKFLLEFMNTSYTDSKESNSYSLYITTCLLIEIPDGLKAQMNMLKIYESFKEVSRPHQKLLFVKNSLLSMFYKAWQSLDKSHPDKAMVFKGLYSDAFDRAEIVGLNNEPSVAHMDYVLLFTGLINELPTYFPSESGSSSLKEKILGGLKKFSEKPPKNETRNLPLCKASILQAYFQVPLSDLTFEECCKEISRISRDFPLFLKDCPPGKFDLILSLFYRQLIGRKWDSIEKSFECYTELLQTCDEILLQKEIQDSTQHREAYTALKERCYESYLKVIKKAIYHLLVNDQFENFKTSSNDAQKLPIICLESLGDRSDTILAWIQKYKMLEISMGTFLVLSELIKDKEKKKVALEMWILIIKRCEGLKRIWSERALIEHILMLIEGAMIQEIDLSSFALEPRK